MAKKIIRFLDKNLFEETSIKEVRFNNDVSLLVGNISGTTDKRLNGISFSDELENIKMLSWIDTHRPKIEFAVALPPDAAGQWLELYDKHLIGGGDADTASDKAWAIIKKAWYEINGKWHKFEESWQKSMFSIEPVIEIFKAGKYPQGDISVADIDTMIKNFEAGLFKPPVTTDHRQDGAAMGWVSGLFRKGEKMYATLSQLATKFIDKVKSGEYKHRSIEMFPNFKKGDKEYGALLTAVSFLGAKIPQIMDLAEPKFSNQECIAFSIDNNEFNNQFKPLKKGGSSLIEISQEQLDAKIKQAEDKAKATTEAESELKFSAERKELEAKNKELSDSLGKDRKKAADAEADKLFTHYASKEGGGKLLPAQKEFYVVQFSNAIQDEDDKVLENLKKVVEANTNQVDFSEITKKKDKANNLTSGGVLKFTDEEAEFNADVQKYLEDSKIKFSIDTNGMTITDDINDLAKAISVVKNRKQNK